MEQNLKEIMQKVFPEIPLERQKAIIQAMADPEKHRTELLNLFQSGNYKIHSDHSREELTTMGKNSNYTQSGQNANIDKDNLKSARHFDLKAKVVEKDESIVVRMDGRDSFHTFIFTKEAIAGFYHNHPIRIRYSICDHFGDFKKSQNSICCQPFDEKKQLITTNGTRETITAVYKDAPGQWQFATTSDSGDAINTAYGDKIRYCAFIEAFTAALVDGSHGGVYEWLYKETCYDAA